MTTYTITTTQNITALAAKAGGDTYSINGGTLVIDCDSRYGLNQGALTGYLGAISMNGTGGSGTLKIDGTKVRLIPFTGGSGNVPAAGATITQGGVTSELLGVWPAINTVPTAAGSAMPSSGFIKVRNVTGGAGVYASGALAGITATSNGADIVGWIEVVGKEALTITGARLSSVSIQGAWLSPFDTTGAEIKTSGAAGQAIQLPASVANSFYAGVYVETASGNGIYERWPSANGLVSSVLPTDERGKYCWITGSGVVTFGSDGTNTVGKVPAAGCRIRVPNILLGNTNATVGYGANALPNSTSTTRFSFGSATPFSIDLANVSWGVNMTTPYSVSLTNSTLLAPWNITNPTTPPVVQNTINSVRDNAQPEGMMYVLNAYSGCTVSDNCFSAQTNNTNYVYVLNVGLQNGTFDRNRVQTMLVPTTSGTGGVETAMSFANMLSADSNEFIGLARTLAMGGTKLTNSKVATWAHGTAQAKVSTAFSVSNGMTNSVIDGLSWLIPTANTCHPYTSLVLVGGSTNCKIRNFGTSISVPLTCGTINPVSTALFTIGYQSSWAGLSLQKIFCDGTVGPYNSYFAQRQYNVENCSSAFASPVAFQQSSSNLRALRLLQIPQAASSAVGLHWADVFLSNTLGALSIMMTDTTSDTAAQVTINAGTPKFTGTSGLVCANVGDSLSWTMQYFAQGHTQLSSVTMSGGLATNYLVEFQVDLNDGNGWSAWQTASNANLQAATINPALGLKLAMRLTCTTATTTVITGLRVNTVSTLAAQNAVSYPLDPVPITVSGIVAGSRIKVTRTDTNAVLANALVTGTAFSLSGDYAGLPIQVEVRCATAPGPFYQPWVASGTPIATTGLTLQALQVRDDQ